VRFGVRGSAFGTFAWLWNLEEGGKKWINSDPGKAGAGRAAFNPTPGPVSARMCDVRLAGFISASCETFLPCLCLHCDEPVGGDRVGLCASCWTLVVPRVGGSCRRCGGPAEGGLDPCLSCQSKSLPQVETIIWGEYDGPLRSAVLALKSGGNDELAVPLGRRLAARIALEEWAGEIDAVTSVPSHPIRRLRVSWPAAACLARVVARELEQPHRRLLRRHGLDRQTGRSRAERIRLPGRALTCPGSVAGQRVLVVDDVTTTGTTLRRAAEALLRGDAEAVYCAAMTATPDARRGT